MLDVTPILSRLRAIATSPQGTATAPILDVKQSSGLVRLKDGDMVIIGGLIQDESSETERKVPLLGDIPYLGRLFKGTYTAKRKSELARNWDLRNPLFGSHRIRISFSRAVIIWKP
jgi:type II secretory pathway component GspD/PulD (secretin)